MSSPYSIPQPPYAHQVPYPMQSVPVPAPIPSTSRSVSLDVMGDANATVARLSFSKDPLGTWPLVSERDLVTGSSKRHPGDKPDAEVGELLAVADALEKLSGKLRRRARGRMRHLESIREHRRQIRAKADEPIPYTVTDLVASLKDASGTFTGYFDKPFEFTKPKTVYTAECWGVGGGNPVAEATAKVHEWGNPAEAAPVRTRVEVEGDRFVIVDHSGNVTAVDRDGKVIGLWHV